MDVVWTQSARELARDQLGVAGKIVEQAVPAIRRFMCPDGPLELDADEDERFLLHVPLCCSVDEAMERQDKCDNWLFEYMPKIRV